MRIGAQQTSVQNSSRLLAAWPLPVLPDGYWRQVGTRKQPCRITLKTGEPVAIAGVCAREPTEFETADCW